MTTTRKQVELQIGNPVSFVWTSHFSRDPHRWTAKITWSFYGEEQRAVGIGDTRALAIADAVRVAKENAERCR